MKCNKCGSEGATNTGLCTRCLKPDNQDEDYTPTHLGRVSNAPTTKLDPVPWKHGKILVRLDCSEFTTHCPVTDQPDFAQLCITYVPDKYIVETKSMKLYLGGYRHTRAFNEALVAKIAQDFYDQIKPFTVTVTGQFNQRGGISVNAEATRSFIGEACNGQQESSSHNVGGTGQYVPPMAVTPSQARD